jgi:hypothetical protein
MARVTRQGKHVGRPQRRSLLYFLNRCRCGHMWLY